MQLDLGINRDEQRILLLDGDDAGAEGIEAIALGGYDSQQDGVHGADVDDLIGLKVERVHASRVSVNWGTGVPINATLCS